MSQSQEATVKNKNATQVCIGIMSCAKTTLYIEEWNVDKTPFFRPKPGKESTLNTKDGNKNLSFISN